MISKKTNEIRTKTLIGLVVLVAFALGMFVQNVSGSRKKNKHNEGNTASSHHSAEYAHLSPFLSCVDEKGLNLSEIHYFRPRIDEYITKVISQHPDIHISYYFRDLNNGIWIGVNEKDEFSPASLMKLPLMITVLKMAQEKPDILQFKILFKKKDFENVDEDSGFEKKDNTYYSIEELLNQMIEYSDNAASLILMQFAGMDKVEKTENDLDLTVSKSADIYSNFVRVKSYAATFRILYNGSYLNREMSEKALGILAKAQFKGGIRAAVPSSYTIAHKYGERDWLDPKGNRKTLQLHHFGIVYYPTKPYLIGVMTRGGATKEIKEKIITDLAKITFEEVEKQVREKKALVNPLY